ncbi:anti-sigma-factor antagonist [Lentzea xinjiangensis]|uniref:Anti-sigma-factor antagonist n=1 Tax=Lentzea xinjiangensis TaxID=402600 RepID=A0A1H9K4U7_9PSEU|nr:STAS domain-containing protein [Lentzea xinjiangensis]SEQ94132.1 anti-sigma-factor antagonist [Lentzea xinjiangensis]
MGDGVQRPELARTEVLVDGGVVVVTMTGEVDLANTDQMRAALEAQLRSLPRGLVVDLALEFLGSSGLSMLVEVQRTAAREGVPLGVVASGRAALRTLELSGLDEALPMFGSVPEAVDSLRRND